jgi:hypothetical protein
MSSLNRPSRNWPVGPREGQGSRSSLDLVASGTTSYGEPETSNLGLKSLFPLRQQIQRYLCNSWRSCCIMRLCATLIRRDCLQRSGRQIVFSAS